MLRHEIAHSSRGPAQLNAARARTAGRHAGAAQPNLTPIGLTRYLGRLVEVKEPNDTKTVYSYDVGGKLASVTVNAAVRPAARTFAYDARRFLGSETHPESGKTDYKYNPRGHVTKRTSAGSDLSFSYDAAEPTGEDWSVGKLAACPAYHSQTRYSPRW